MNNECQYFISLINQIIENTEKELLPHTLQLKSIAILDCANYILFIEMWKIFFK